MTQPTANNMYPVANATSSTASFIEVFQARDPTPNDVTYQIQQRWWNSVANTEWVLTAFNSSGGSLQAVWRMVGTGFIPVETLTGDAGGPVSPIAGNISLIGDGIITTDGNPPGANITFGLTGIVPSAHGGTGVASPTAHTLPVAEGAAPFNFLGPLTSGQVLIGSTGADPVPNVITPGPGISIVNGPGSITIAAQGAGFTWQRIVLNQTLAASNGYICVAPGGGLLLALPAAANIGDTIRVILQGATSFMITQPGGVEIHFGSLTTTPGPAGNLFTNRPGAMVELVCIQTNTEWEVTDSISNFIVT